MSSKPVDDLAAGLPAGARGAGALPAIGGAPPDPGHLPPGCAFAARCPLATDRCSIERPPLVDGFACWEVS